LGLLSLEASMANSTTGIVNPFLNVRLLPEESVAGALYQPSVSLTRWGLNEAADAAVKERSQ